MEITKLSIARYLFMPEILPRIRGLIGVGFMHLPFFLALVFQAVRLLPAYHPYTIEANRGRYGIRHVIAEAANNLEFKRENIDQIILFGTILAGFVMIILQIGLLTASLFFQPAAAQSFADYFVTESPHQDIAHIMLDMVFGVPEIFNSCVSTTVPCLDSAGKEITRAQGGNWIFAYQVFPFPIHVALHQMFQIYSTGLMVVGVIITGYFIITILAETAQTGTAFGKRFNKVWAPLRLVAAFGLLVPIAFGLNSAQYIVLHAAKYGSAFATNGWILFNDVLKKNTLEQVELMVSKPNPPEMGGLLQFMNVARTCQWTENFKQGRQINMYLVRGPLDKNPTFPMHNIEPLPSQPSDAQIQKRTSALRAWRTGDAVEAMKASTYDDLMTFANGQKEVRIRFGLYDDLKYARHSGNVFPSCGEIVFPLHDSLLRGQSANNNTMTGAEIMQRYYWHLLKKLWFNDLDILGTGNTKVDYAKYDACKTINNRLCNEANAKTKPDQAFKTELQNYVRESLEMALKGPITGDLQKVLKSSVGAVDAQIRNGEFNVSPTLMAKGWGGAGMWYNKVAELNGALTTATLNVPLPSRYPFVLEYVRLKKMQEEPETQASERFNPKMKDGAIDRYADEATAMYTTFSFWQEGHANSANDAITDNIFIDTINAIFGTQGLYDMRENRDVHPLAGLAGIGRSLIDSSIRNIGYAAIGGLGGAIGNMFDSFFGSVGASAAGFFVTTAMMALTVGFVLFYVIPFLPFIYYFFAMCGWVKGIFEAMLGAPLWALAHIRIDGDGLPGKAAEGGYYLIFEIFLRPILIVFGLIASIVVYAAMVQMLNDTLTIVTENITGYSADQKGDDISALSIDFYRGPIDQFFYTVVYAIIVYMMGMASFKLIDQIPNKILRWMGQGVQTFGDLKQDPTQQLVGSVQTGATQAVGSIGGGLNRLIGGISKSTG